MTARTYVSDHLLWLLRPEGLNGQTKAESPWSAADRPSSCLRSGPARAEPERVLQTSRAGRRGRSSVPCKLFVYVRVYMYICIHTDIHIRT